MDCGWRKNEEEGIPMMEVDFPTKEAVLRQKNAVLAAALPQQGSLWNKIREIYWEPGIRVVFYQCGSAWLVTGMTYLLVMAGCVIVGESIRARTFFALSACPILYLIFSFISLWSEEQAAVVELKQTMRYSFSRIISLRMFYTSIIIIIFNLAILPAMRGCPMREVWSMWAAGISSSFLFALLSLYLYHRIRSHCHIGIMTMVWTLLSVALVRYGGTLYPILFVELPAAVHFIAAACCLVGFMEYIRRVEKNACA